MTNVLEFPIESMLTTRLFLSPQLYNGQIYFISDMGEILENLTNSVASKITSIGLPTTSMGAPFHMRRNFNKRTMGTS